MYHGIINVYKEAGYTSHDVVAKLRGICGQKKIGHTGTLDPDAVGVLPVCLGNGTKLCDMLTDKQKEYVAGFRLGVVTDTQDLSGKVLKRKPVESSREEVEKAVFSFLGESMQVPPMYSALKVNGKKLYELAREGKEIERKARLIEIYDIKIRRFLPPDAVELDVDCSKGTYIRTLCADIGKALGCGGHMAELLRTAAGAFTIENAVRLSQLKEWAEQEQAENHLLSMEQALREFPKIRIAERFTKLLVNGARLPAHSFVEKGRAFAEGETAAVYDSTGNLTGLYTVRKDEAGLYIKPLKMLI